MTHLFRIEDTSPYAKSIVEFLQSLDFVKEEKVVKTPKQNREKESIIKNIKQSVKEFQLIQEGKLRAISAKDLLDEL
jgi:hypothetical protein